MARASTSDSTDGAEFALTAAVGFGLVIAVSRFAYDERMKSGD